MTEKADVIEGFDQERRGLFDGLKVPFDLNAILIALGALLTFRAGVWLYEWGYSHEDLIPGMIGNLTLRLGFVGRIIDGLLAGSMLAPAIDPETGLRVARSFNPADYFFFYFWAFAIWAFASAAINRIAAMKIAREEGLELKNALDFARTKVVHNFLSIVFVAVLFVLFYLVCNATLAGWVARIPYVGDVLIVLIFPLVLLSTFFLVFALALGVLGFNLSSSAIATESSDTFDGVSRAWNYILARPWQFLLYHGLMVLYIGVFLFFGSYFLKMSVKSLGVGWWGMGHDARQIEVEDRARTETVTVPGKAEYIYHVAVLRDWDSKSVPYVQLDEDGDPTGEVVNVAPHLEGTLRWFAAPVLFGLLWLAKQVMYAYVIAYFFSASTTAYFLLRKDVEGDDYTEIITEEDEEEESFDAEMPKDAAAAAKPLPVVPAGEPPPSGAPAPASTTTTPAPGGEAEKKG